MMRTSEAPKCRVAKLSGSCGVRARALTEWRPAPPPWAARPNCPCAWQPSIASPATQIAGTTKAHVAGTRRASQKKCARAPGPPDAPRGHVPLEENAHRLHIAAAPACPEMRAPGVEPGSQAWEACTMPLHYVRHEVHSTAWPTSQSKTLGRWCHSGKMSSADWALLPQAGRSESAGQ